MAYESILFAAASLAALTSLFLMSWPVLVLGMVAYGVGMVIFLK